jgi:hypothetical protein
MGGKSSYKNIQWTLTRATIKLPQTEETTLALQVARVREYIKPFNTLGNSITAIHRAVLKHHTTISKSHKC